MINFKNIFSYLLYLLFILIGQRAFTQEPDPFIQEKIDELQYDSLLSKLQAFENLGIKQVGTAALDATANWLINQHQTYGYTDIETDTFLLGNNQVYNIIVTKTGTVYPDTYLIVDGHYDTYNGPGVNDNGSGTAIVLEMARMLANIETAYSIKFIHFTAEELGLVGSTHYVDNIVVPQNMDIRLVLNIDEVGGVAGMVNNTITCERDEWSPNGNNAASAAFTDTLANLTEIYSNLNTNISYAYGSDYVPFMDNGYVVTGYYEYNESPYPHSINDSLSNLDPAYVFELTRASLAATLYFSKYINNTTQIPEATKEDNGIEISPNPFIDHLKIHNGKDQKVRILIYDMTGNIVFHSTLKANSTVELSTGINPGIYILRAYSIDGTPVLSQKIVKR